jgi:hypothetical protein
LFADSCRKLLDGNVLETVLCFGCGEGEVSGGDGREERGRRLTGRDVVVWFEGYVVGDLEVVDSLEDGETLADGGDADALEGFRVHHTEDVAGDAVFCTASSQSAENAGQDSEQTLDAGLVLGEAKATEPGLHLVLVPFDDAATVVSGSVTVHAQPAAGT